MNGRDYARYFNMLLECRKEMEYGYSYGFNDLKFSELDDHILKELKRVADVLKIQSKKDIEKFAQPHLEDVAEGFLLKE